MLEGKEGPESSHGINELRCATTTLHRGTGLDARKYDAASARGGTFSLDILFYRTNGLRRKFLAPRVGLEPMQVRLTAMQRHERRCWKERGCAREQEQAKTEGAIFDSPRLGLIGFRLVTPVN